MKGVREEALLALRAAHPRTVGYAGGCDQVEGKICAVWRAAAHVPPSALMRNCPHLGPYNMTKLRALWWS